MEAGRRLAGKVAIVTGASRGIGRGIATALGREGATVYVTGRTGAEGASPLPGTVGATAEEVSHAGGRGIAVVCDHSDDAAVEALFARVAAEQGRLDLLVNSASGMLPNPEIEKTVGKPFWEIDRAIYDLYTGVGLRSHYVTSWLAARMMVPAGRGLIVNVSSEAARTYFLSVPAGICKAGVDKLTADAAFELRAHGVSTVSIWPGLVRTERNAELEARGLFDLSTAESTDLSGQAVVALACDPDIARRSGGAFHVAALARDYGFTEADGSVPPVTVLEQVFLDSGAA